MLGSLGSLAKTWAPKWLPAFMPTGTEKLACDCIYHNKAMIADTHYLIPPLATLVVGLIDRLQ